MAALGARPPAGRLSAAQLFAAERSCRPSPSGPPRTPQTMIFHDSGMDFYSILGRCFNDFAMDLHSVFLNQWSMNYTFQNL